MDTTELQNQAIEIRDAENEGENTATKVGTLLVNIIQVLEGTVTEESLTETLKAVEEVLQRDYASLENNTVKWHQRGVIFLKSMGSDLDNIDGGSYTPTTEVGDTWFSPTSGGLVHKTQDGNEAWFVRPDAVYINSHTLRVYKWASGSMVELGSGKNPVMIDYMVSKTLDSIAVGEVFWQSSNSKLVIKTGESSVRMFSPDPSVIYCARDTKSLMFWDTATSTWQSVGGGGVSVSFSQGVTNIIIGGGGGGGGGTVETTAAPTISVADSGLNKVVTITNDADETGATIYYTTDGSDPTANSQVYSSPITISASGPTTIKAIAKASGKLTSSIVAQSVYIEPNDWTDGVRFTRNTSGGTTEAEGYSISPYIPVENGDYLWLWNGILYDDTQSPYTTIVLYDSNKNHLGEYHTMHYERAITLAMEGVAYIRFLAKTADKEKTFVRKYTTSTAGDSTGVFLFKGNKIDSENYGKLCGFTKIDSNGALSIAAMPSSGTAWKNKINHPVVSAMFDLSKYSSIDIKHGWNSSSQHIIRFYDSNGDTASRNYYTADTTDDTREGMSTTQLGVYTNARIQICGFSIHDCYLVGHWTDENEVEREEYVWKGCNVITE